MTRKKIMRLSALLASTVLTIAALALYGGGLAQEIQGKQQKAEQPVADAVDSIALEKGMAELQKITDRYQKSNLMVTGEIRYFGGDSAATTPAEKTPFSFGVAGPNSIYELDSVITVTAEDIALIVDKKDQSIAVIEKSSLEVQPGELHPMPDVFSEMKQYIKSIAISAAGQYRQLTILLNGESPSNLLEYVIVYDPQSYAIKKLRMKIASGEITDGLPEADEQDKGSVAVSDDDELFFVDSANNAIPTGMYAALDIDVYEIVYSQERVIEKSNISPWTYVRKDNDEYVPAGKFKDFSILQ